MWSMIPSLARFSLADRVCSKVNGVPAKCATAALDQAKGRSICKKPPFRGLLAMQFPVSQDEMGTKLRIQSQLK